MCGGVFCVWFGEVDVVVYGGDLYVGYGGCVFFFCGDGGF